MATKLALAAVVLGTVLLVTGIVLDVLALIYVAIGLSASSGVALAAVARRQRQPPPR